MRINIYIGKLTFIILGILIFQSSFCQENYLPGHLIALNGDTIHGFIDYRNWSKNPNKIYFSGRIDGEMHIYTPNDLIGFSVQDEIYVSAIVKTEISPTKTNELQYDPELIINIDTVFLQTMIQGSKSLYYYKGSNAKDQFYIKEDSSFNLLIYKRYLKKHEGTNVISVNKKYLGQLTFYFKDCPSIQSKLGNTKYNKKSIENLFLFYYDCTQSKVEFHKKTEKLSIEIGILAGVSLTSIKFRSDDFDCLVNADFPLSVNFSAGLFLDVILPRNQRKWSIYNEIIFTSYKFDDRHIDYENENKYTITYTEIGYSYLKLINMLRFKYPVGNLFVYINAGISNGFAISETNYEKEESKYYSIEKVKEGKALNETRKYEQGLVFGLGTKFKKYSFEMRYEIGSGISTYSALKSSTNRYYFLFGYRF